MQKVLLASAFLLLAACAPMNPQVPPAEQAASSSSSEPESGSGDVEVTLEPFAEPTQATASSGAALPFAESIAADTLVIGDTDAPASMTIFLHPSSPYARDFQRTRMPILLKEFVEPGLLSIRLATLPINKYPGTEDVVRTTQCAWEHNHGYAAHALLYEKGTTSLDTEDMEELDLDPTTMHDCMSILTGDVLFNSRALAAQHNVTLVPTYVIDGEVFVGLPTEADLLGQIRSAL